ncbi:NAD(P)H-dependent oxidoreductase [Phocoenobacter skyensis]|uniref:NAD(P)H-dependent oxidoreductase n=1 Tax=Phocoenobacter skyensis TaxID=97481 RepID=A0A1H7X6Z8_9PAST|nr:NAD(P)H-dependent oxidoreductase [Pasteurella skyensis]MDP8079621.1 NAD(P)H-dependent oxidoreductase [Pasteurella skyensis]MDP8085570.1 NAD(P)H-dependent oxidoreductase [Pasteurella skyensis]MDP8185624.1 NAD(P)H-dependent oxidoreductase [Pasteurella skyensis]QLB21942.1 NAD(P)H-dependent oxidoreductase [Pasteurella skyensis]SEM29473.1 Nitroreductase [Pasteurella skyensis]
MSKITKQQILDAALYRCAIRDYDPTKKISEEDFNVILELARLSPSSVGSEPWKFLVIQNPELRQKLKPVSWGMKTQLDDASHLVFLLAHKNMRYDTDFFRQKLQSRGLSGEKLEQKLQDYKRFQQSDIDILDSERTLFDWASKQTYIALGNMMNGAAMMGIDSCPVEGMNYKAVTDILVEAGLFNPNEYGVSVAVTFGYRSDKPLPAKSRKKMDDIVIWAE